jgi:hypothetical protein
VPEAGASKQLGGLFWESKMRTYPEDVVTYKIWFKQMLGSEHKEYWAEFSDILIARLTWDMYSGNGWYMMSARP